MGTSGWFYYKEIIELFWNQDEPVSAALNFSIICSTVNATV